MIAEILRLVAVGEMFAQRDEQIAVVGLRDAAAVMIARRQRPLLTEDDLDVVEAAVAVVQFRARDRGASAAVGALGEAEIDRPVLRKGFVGDDVEQAALAGRPDVGHALERRRELPFRRDDAHAARPLGHQHRSVGQERQRPRIGRGPWRWSEPRARPPTSRTPALRRACRWRSASETASRIAAVSETVTSPTGVFIAAPIAMLIIARCFAKDANRKTPELSPESASPWSP